MKHLKIAGLCLVSMFVMGMAVAGTASAAVRWEGCLLGGTATRYTNETCTVAGIGAERWSWQEIKNTDRVISIGFTLTLTDKNTIAGVSKVRCTAGGVNSGSVGPENFDKVELARVEKAKENCRALEGGCKTEGIKAVEGIHLEWQTTVVEVGGVFTDTLEGGGAGKEPGWKVECETLLGNTIDECESEVGKPETATLENVKSRRENKEEQLILATFNKARLSTCSLGGKESGVVEGQAAILLGTANNEHSLHGLRLGLR